MIKYEFIGKVAIIELNRHEKRNALTTELTVALREALHRAVADQARIIAITGSGTSFSAGADLEGALYEAEFLSEHLETLRTMQTIEVPLMAIMNGPAMGAGLQLALACDVRVMDASAKIGVPAPKIGVTVDAWTIKRFAHTVGWGHARSLFFCLQEFDAQKCLNLGFANQIADKEEALTLAHALSTLAPLTLRHYKKVFNDDGAQAAVDKNIEQAMLDVWLSDDLHKGRNARIERKLPEYTGT